MVRAFKRNHARAPAREQRGFERHLHRVRTRTRKQRAHRRRGILRALGGGAWKKRAKFFEQLHLDVGRLPLTHRVQQRAALARNRLGDARVRVANVRNAETRDQIHEAVAVGVPNICATRALPKNGRRILRRCRARTFGALRASRQRTRTRPRNGAAHLGRFGFRHARSVRPPRDGDARRSIALW